MKSWASGPGSWSDDVRRIVRHGHERWDGTGYPDGLPGQEIPLGARIVFAADAYHAMVSDRAYRPAMPIDAAIEELRANAGTQFDPTVIAVLTEIIERSGELGVASGGQLSPIRRG